MPPRKKKKIAKASKLKVGHYVRLRRGPLAGATGKVVSVWGERFQTVDIELDSKEEVRVTASYVEVVKGR